MTISNESRGRIKKVFEPIALAMGRMGLTPNALTLIGFAIIGYVLISMSPQAKIVGLAWLLVGIVALCARRVIRRRLRGDAPSQSEAAAGGN